MQGVGKPMLNYNIIFLTLEKKNASPRDSLGLLTMLRKMRSERGFGTQTLGGFLECFGAKFEQHFPLTWRELA
jgi:hypothetical protein